MSRNHKGLSCLKANANSLRAETFLKFLRACFGSSYSLFWTLYLNKTSDMVSDHLQIRKYENYTTMKLSGDKIIIFFTTSTVIATNSTVLNKR